MEREYEEYLIALGRITATSASLESLAIHFSVVLSDEADWSTFHASLLLKGLASNMRLLRRMLKKRLEESHFRQVSAVIAKADRLRVQRNENVHGSWNRMIDARTGRLHHVQRIRYYVDKRARDLKWDVHTPTVQTLEQIGKDLGACTDELNKLLTRFLSIDDVYVSWRLKRSERRRSLLDRLRRFARVLRAGL
jgi:hypothetical protein